jgi:hypothetical protein
MGVCCRSALGQRERGYCDAYLYYVFNIVFTTALIVSKQLKALTVVLV